MKMTFKYAPIFVLGILFWSGCYYDVEEVLYPVDDCDTTAVSYANDILPVLLDQCYGCHSGNVLSGNVDIEGYDNVKTLVDNGKLLGVVRYDAGFVPMPQGAAQLPDCDISKMEAWVENGAPDN